VAFYIVSAYIVIGANIRFLQPYHRLRPSGRRLSISTRAPRPSAPIADSAGKHRQISPIAYVIRDEIQYRAIALWPLRLLRSTMRFDGPSLPSA
jgi:hypothetical protein